jgi:hypothetical protein
MIRIYDEQEHQQAINIPQAGGGIIGEVQVMVNQRARLNNFDNMFQELNQYYMQQQQQQQQQQTQETGGLGDRRQECQNNTVDLELRLYRQEMPIRLYQEELYVGNWKQVFNCPLAWWKINETKFPLLAHLAQRLLCITGTSAPSKRVFSNAGITIAKDRARLLPETAGELIFLKQATPVLVAYEQSLLEH